MNKKEITKHRKNKSTKLWLVLWMIVFLLVGAVVMYLFTLGGASKVTDILSNKSYWLSVGVANGLIMIAFLLMYRVDAQNIALRENDLEDTEWLTVKRLRKLREFTVTNFDSMSEQEKLAVEQLQQTVPEKICRLPECKDDTDMLAAIKRGLELGYNDFRIYAATGGRFDHTLANIQCLLYLKNHGAVGYLVDGTGMVLVLQNEAVHFRKELEGTMSLFALTKEAKGVNICGMKYPLENAVITNDFPIGISNEFLGEEAEVSVEDGELVCMIRYYEDEV